jgi:hypothetical protein
VAELADARVSKTRSDKEYRFDSDRPHHLVITGSIMKNPLTIREEANALTCCAFRNGYLENLHAGKHSRLLEQPGLSRITDAEMKKLMIEASAKLAELLAMKEANRGEYWRQLQYFNQHFCGHWEK